MLYCPEEVVEAPLSSNPQQMIFHLHMYAQQGEMKDTSQSPSTQSIVWAGEAPVPSAAHASPAAEDWLLS